MTAANGFGPWLRPSAALRRVVDALPPQTRSDYRTLSTPAIIDLIALSDRARVLADTEDDQVAAEFALQELRAVLQERR